MSIGLINLIILDTILFLGVLLISCRMFLLESISEISCDFRDFISKNESFFDILFLFSFGLEQILLFYLIYKFSISSLLFQLFIGILVLIVLTTSSLQKIVSDVRNKELKNRIHRKNMEVEKIHSEYNYLKELIKSKYKVK